MSRELVIGYAALRIGYAAALLAAPERTARPWLGDVAKEAGRRSPCVGWASANSSSRAARRRARPRAARRGRGWRPAPRPDSVDPLATLVSGGGRLPAKAKPGTVAAAGVVGAAGGAACGARSVTSPVA
jgi:hypothetical protein